MSEVMLKGQFTKVDNTYKTAYGWAYVTKIDGQQVTDHSGDETTIEDIEKAAHNFVIDCRIGKEMHNGTQKAILVESFVFSKAKQDALGIDLGKEGWFVGFKIMDDEVLKKIESGELSMFSIGGTGIREEVDD